MYYRGSERGEVMSQRTRQGWVAGDIVASESDPGRGRWLTVWGAYNARPVLHGTAGDARADTRRGESVAHVTEVPYPGIGWAYLVTAGTLADR